MSDEIEQLKALGIPEQLIAFILQVQETKKKEGLEVSAAEVLDQLVMERSQLAQELQDIKGQEPNGHQADSGGTPPYYESLEDIGLDLARVNRKDLMSTLVKSILNPKVPLFDPNKMELLIYLREETGVDIFGTLAFGRAALSRGYEGVGTAQIVDIYRKVGSNKAEQEKKANFVMRNNQKEV